MKTGFEPRAAPGIIACIRSTTGQCRTTLAILALAGLLVLPACGPDDGQRVDPALKRFAQAKKANARALVAKQKLRMPREAWRVFEDTIHGHWQHATNTYMRLPGLTTGGVTPAKPGWRQVVADRFWLLVAKLGYRRPVANALQSEAQVPVGETFGALQQFRAWDNHLLHLYGDAIISSIPTNSVFFGGTEPGRLIVSALSEAQVEGQPFFTICQNTFADGRYLAYLRDIYGKRISVPSAEDSQKAFQLYLTGAQLRLNTRTLKAGENVVRTGNRIMVSGRTAVTEINALIARTLFDQNPDLEFYVEQSWPLDWMYPYLSPHGPVLKLNRQALPELPQALVAKDRRYWQDLGQKLIGDAVTPTNSLESVCDFVRRVYVRKEFSSYNGDQAYPRNRAAQTGFSSLRSAIAGLYAWRAGQSATAVERDRMLREAEFAYRQALALGPANVEAVERYADFLLSQERTLGAAMLLETSLAADPANQSLAVRLKDLPDPTGAAFRAPGDQPRN